MYLQHFGLIEAPFGITPDTSFAFAARAHQEALNTLLLAIREGEGFVKITGEVGTGKTLLCRRFLATLGEDCRTAYLPNPLLRPQTLMLALAKELGIDIAPETDEYTLMKALNDLLLREALEGRRVVVCLDEVQAMPLATLETVRLLSNLETEKRKLLQVVLFGQPELDDRLADPSVRQIRQRIAFNYRLNGLTRDELQDYLNHRLRVAGHRGAALFEGAATTSLYRASRGIPRLVNILAHKSLISAFGRGARSVSAAHVRRAAKDTEGARLSWFAGLTR
jgi:MSHA biogenesis protein MshM